MSVQITIVGLGQIGSSIGLALKAHEVDAQRVGHDKDPQAAKESQRIGAVDDVKYNLPASVREAKIVILALPLAEVRETLKIIAARRAGRRVPRHDLDRLREGHPPAPIHVRLPEPAGAAFVTAAGGQGECGADAGRGG